jgi:hypothetical protein
VILNTHLHLSAEVKNEWTYPPAPPIRLHLVNSGKFIFLFTLCQSADLTLAVCHIRVEPNNVLTTSLVRLFKARSNPLHRVMDHRFHCVASKLVSIHVRMISLRIYCREINGYSV